MNEQIEQISKEGLEKALAWANTAENFAVEQTPIAYSRNYKTWNNYSDILDGSFSYCWSYILYHLEKNIGKNLGRKFL